MSTFILTSMTDHSLHRFWGGDRRGECIRITAREREIAHTGAAQFLHEGFVDLTMKEASALCDALADLLRGEPGGE